MKSRAAAKIYNMGILRPTAGLSFDMVLMNSVDVNQEFIRRMDNRCKRVVFCDGALHRYHHLFETLKLEKHWVGDFDSSDTEASFEDVISHEIADQETNDLEKALYLLESIKSGRATGAPKWKDCCEATGNVIVNGTTGGRFDHQMYAPLKKVCAVKAAEVQQSRLSPELLRFEQHNGHAPDTRRQDKHLAEG